MWERAVQVFLASLIISIATVAYNICKKNKQEKEKKGKVYYGVFRVVLLYLSAIISSEVLMMLIFGSETIEGIEALILTLIGSIPFMCVYMLIYKRYQERKLEK